MLHGWDDVHTFLLGRCGSSERLGGRQRTIHKLWKLQGGREQKVANKMAVGHPASRANVPSCTHAC